MAGIAAGDFLRVQPLGIEFLPRSVDILHLEIELQRHSAGNPFVGLRQLKARLIAQFNHPEIFPLGIWVGPQGFKKGNCLC